jgi:hypothetical protein
VVSDKPDLPQCLTLFYEQLTRIILENGFTDVKYHRYYDQLFYQLNAVKHDNRAISNEIGNFKRQLDWFQEDNLAEDKKSYSINLVNKINQDMRQKFNFQSSIKVFIEFFKKHYADPVWVDSSVVEYYHPKHRNATIH